MHPPPCEYHTVVGVFVLGGRLRVSRGNDPAVHIFPQGDAEVAWLSGRMLCMDDTPRNKSLERQPNSVSSIDFGMFGAVPARS